MSRSGKAGAAASARSGRIVVDQHRLLQVLSPFAVIPDFERRTLPEGLLVLIRWHGRVMAVPLSQLAAIDPDNAIAEVCRASQSSSQMWTLH
jgi:hypothetical protein